MMQRTPIRAALVFGIVLSVLLTGYVVAAPLSNPTWISGIQVQNLDPINTANITITYYNSDGSQNASQADTISPGQSKTYFGNSMAAGSGFAGSAVVSSDTKVAAIVNETASNPTMAESYDGVSSTATANTLYVPLVMKNNGGWSTTIYLQNAGSSDATNVQLTFNGTSNFVYTIPTIKAGASFVLPQATMSQMGTKWIGSVTVNSNQPVAASINETNGSVLLAYSATTSGGSKVYAPLLMNNNKGWYTGFQVMNVGSSAATVNLKINGNQVDQVVIPAGNSKTWYPIPGMPSTVAGGSAEGATGTEQLVGIVNEINATSGDNSMSYEAINQ